jgi:hypothetical protein
MSACPICGAEMEIVDCDACFGDGEWCDEDPVNGDEWFPCETCHSTGVVQQCSALPHTTKQLGKDLS